MRRRRPSLKSCDRSFSGPAPWTSSSAVRLRGFRLIGPLVKGGAICYGDVASAAAEAGAADPIEEAQKS